MIELGSNHAPLNLSALHEANSLDDALKRAEGYCKGCKVASPMVCVERCDVWRVKNEIVQTRSVVGESGHARYLLNAMKNKRRLKILQAVCERSLTLKELQARLRQSGFRHSQQTLREAYLKPMVRAGLVREDGSRFRVTFYGRKIRIVFTFLDAFGLLPIHSFCYEEAVLRELRQPKGFTALAEHVPAGSLSRILTRLRARGLLVKSQRRRSYVFYFRVKGRVSGVKLSPTERRVFDAIPQTGVSVRQLSGVVSISRRRTFKYLRRLRDKKLVFALKAPRTYELTEQGRGILRALDEIDRLACSSFNIPVPLVSHH